MDQAIDAAIAAHENQIGALAATYDIPAAAVRGYMADIMAMYAVPVQDGGCAAFASAHDVLLGTDDATVWKTQEQAWSFVAPPEGYRGQHR